MSGSWGRVAAVTVTVTAGLVPGQVVGPGVEAGAQSLPGIQVTVTEITTAEGLDLVVGPEAVITESGEVLVEVREASGRTRPAVWRRGAVRRVVGPPDADRLVVFDMSEDGQVVGGFGVPCTRPVPAISCTLPFTWKDGEFQAIPLDTATMTGNTAVNDRGQVLVSHICRRCSPPPSPIGSDVAGVVVWDGEESVTPPISDAMNGSDINNRGQVALRLTTRGPQGETGAEPAIWQVGGDLRRLGTLGGTFAYPVDISERGHVIGTEATGVLRGRAFLWHRGEMTDLGTLGGDSSFPVAVNDRGHVLGYSDTADLRVHPFVWRRGEMTDLGVDVVAAEDRFPLDINNRGQVAGTRLDPSSRGSAFFWHDGHLVDLGQVAGAREGSTAFDINDRGQIVGSVDGRPVIWTVRT